MSKRVKIGEWVSEVGSGVEKGKEGGFGVIVCAGSPLS